MKHLILLTLLSTSLTAFSQVDTLKLGNRKVTPTDSVPENIKRWIDTVRFAPLPEPYMTLEVKPSVFWTGEVITFTKPDTLRAIILVTMCRRCAAEPMPGYVVIEQGKRPVYLDCRKRALKGKQMGWDFREVDVNYKQK